MSDALEAQSINPPPGDAAVVTRRRTRTLRKLPADSEIRDDADAATLAHRLGDYLAAKHTAHPSAEA